MDWAIATPEWSRIWVAIGAVRPTATILRTKDRRDTAPDFTAPTTQGEINFHEWLGDSWGVLFSHPKDFTPVCTAQLCDYRDIFDSFASLGVSLVGISADPPEKHKEFAAKHGFSFPLLCDPDKSVAKAFGCTSKWTLGMINRAVCVVNTQGEIVWRKVEPFGATRRKAGELREVLEDLKKQGLI